MFGLWGKKNEPVIVGGDTPRVPGMPVGLYTSRDVENLRFHDKRRVWYNAKQVDDALDKVKATLEWWESVHGGLSADDAMETVDETDAHDHGQPDGGEPGGLLDVGLPSTTGAHVDTVEEIIDLSGQHDAGETAIKTVGATDDADAERKPAIDPLASETAGHSQSRMPVRTTPTVDLSLTVDPETADSRGVDDGETMSGGDDAGNDESPETVGASAQTDDSRPAIEQLADLAGKSKTVEEQPARGLSVPSLSAADAPKIPANPFLRRR